MARITAIRPQRRPGRYNIMVDDAFAIAVSEKVLIDLQLAVGSELDEAQLAATAGAEDSHKALSASLRLLESRARSQNEIEDRLKQHGYDPSTIETVTTKLTGYGLIDDAQFAASWIESRSRSRPAGVRKLKSELYQKGVARDTIDSAVSTVTEDDELSLAKRAITKRTTPLPQDSVERRAEYTRQANYLARRGFGWNTVKQVLAERFGAAAEEED